MPDKPSLQQAGRPRRRFTAIALSSAAAIGLLAGLNLAPAGNAAPAAPAAPVAAAPWTGYADLIEQVMPSVVAITAKHEASDQLVSQQGGPGDFRSGPGWREYRFGPGQGQGQGGPNDEMMRRFMERFFGQQMPPFEGSPGGPNYAPTALGSGFIVRDDGLIVTNNHVVEGASDVTVTLQDGTELHGNVIGTDPDTDLALIKVDPGNLHLQAVAFANSDKVRVGDPVIAIGSPFGLGGTVTAGIVSAEHREIGIGRYDDFLQIDAPINRGNSGGPTFNLQGEVIGVNSLIHSPSGGNVGIGFAIPSNEVKQIVADLEDDGTVQRGWLGVNIQAIDQDLAQSLGLESDKGALVAAVTDDSPAASAGLERGDVIVSFDGKQIERLTDLTRMVADKGPGKDAKVTVLRDGSEKTFDVELGQMPNQNQVVASNEQPGDHDTPKLGVVLAQLTPEARHQLNLSEDTQGVVVTDVQPGSPAADKGLQPGDVIVEADRTQVKDPAMVAQAVRKAAEKGQDSILLLIQRDGQDRFVAVRLERA